MPRWRHCYGTGQNCSRCTLLVFADIKDLQSSNLCQGQHSEEAERSRAGKMKKGSMSSRAILSSRLL